MKDQLVTVSVAHLFHLRVGEVHVVRRGTTNDGVPLFAIMDDGCVLHMTGQWVFEPLPSDRSDEFNAATRWPFDEALRRAKQCKSR